MCAKVCEIVQFHVYLPLNKLILKKNGKIYMPPAKFEPPHVRLAVNLSKILKYSPCKTCQVAPLFATFYLKKGCKKWCNLTGLT